jgi:hypothetical protein
MKKIIFSALAIVAFSLTSFANGVENKNVVEPIKQLASTEIKNSPKDDFCFTFYWTFTRVTGAGTEISDGITITVERVEITFCI